MRSLGPVIPIFSVKFPGPVGHGFYNFMGPAALVLPFWGPAAHFFVNSQGLRRIFSIFPGPAAHISNFPGPVAPGNFPDPADYVVLC